MAACRRRSAAWRNSLRTNRTSRSMRRLSVRWRGRSKCVGPAPWGNKSSIRGRHSVYIDQNHKWLRDRSEQWIRGAGDGEVPRGFRRRQFCARLRKDAAAWDWYVPEGRGRRAEGNAKSACGMGAWGAGTTKRRGTVRFRTSAKSEGELSKNVRRSRDNCRRQFFPFWQFRPSFQGIARITRVRPRSGGVWLSHSIPIARARSQVPRQPGGVECGFCGGLA
jgi:hypothetical protein